MGGLEERCERIERDSECNVALLPANLMRRQKAKLLKRVKKKTLLPLTVVLKKKRDFN